MYVTAQVQAGVIQNALFVPNSGVLRDEQNMPYVYLQTAKGQFARRDVTLGETQAGKTQILTGLQANDRVVGDGSLFSAVPELASALKDGRTNVERYKRKTFRR
jgi:cobalt-zinc-cadmium efflux system membrane fusion protein